MASATVSPQKGCGSGEHFVEHAAEGENHRAFVDGALRGPARGTCSQRLPMITPGMVGLCANRAGEVMVGESARPLAVIDDDDDGFSSVRGSPKSSTFATPSGVTITLPGLRSRWMTPFSCAASNASAICLARLSDSSTGIGRFR